MATSPDTTATRIKGRERQRQSDNPKYPARCSPFLGAGRAFGPDASRCCSSRLNSAYKGATAHISIHSHR